MNPLLKQILTFVSLMLAVLWYLARRHAAAQAPLRSATGPLPNEVEAVLFGTRLMAEGVHFYADWSAAMVREFDRRIESALPSWYRIAEDLSDRPSEQWRAAAVQLLANQENGAVLEP